MNSLFKGTILSLGLGFAVAFGIIVLPAFFKNPDIFGSFAAGFVNPFAAGYSMDTIFCWLILAIWVAYEAKVRQIRYGWGACCCDRIRILSFDQNAQSE